MAKVNTKEQDENERYVKYYELQACLTESLKSVVAEMNARFDEISANTKGLVTYEQHKKDLDSSEDKLRKEFCSQMNSLKESFSNEIKLVMAEFNPTKRNFDKIGWIVISAVVSAITAVLVGL